MQQVKGHMLSSLVVISLTLAALSAPPSVFAETAPPPAPALPAVPAPVAGSIRIGLGAGLSAAEVTAPGGIYVVGDGVMQAQLPPGEVVTLTLDAGQIAVSGLAAKFATVRLVPVGPATTATAPPTTPISASPIPTSPISAPTVPAKPANPITYKGKTYRGEVLAVIAPGSKKLSVVNVVNVEEYLLGVVPEEVSYTWPLEAIKAQAVAARTYALGNLGRRESDGYDLVSDTGDQFYGGIASERLQTSQAVAMTQGQLLTYGGRPISAMYHSSSGGHTENNEIIYNSIKVDYLRGVKDFDDVPGNRYFRWEYTYTLAEFSQSLKSLGYEAGTVTAVAPLGLQESASGRPRQFAITGVSGGKTLTGGQIRSALNLPSNPRSIIVQPGGYTPTIKNYAASESVAVMGAGGAAQQRTSGSSAIVSAGQTPTAVTGSVTAMGAKANQSAGIIVSGGGHGHAVGMSQWGAYGMAMLGRDYVTILTHFYTGTKLETR